MCICLQMRLSKLSHVMANLLTPLSIIDSGDQADCLVVLGMATSNFMKTGIVVKSELPWKLCLSTVPPLILCQSFDLTVSLGFSPAVQGT